MRAAKRSGWLIGAAAAVAVLCLCSGIAFALRGTIARAAISLAGNAIGHVRVRADVVRIGWHDATLRGVRVDSLNDQPIARIGRIAIAYDLRDLLPGGRRRYGLRALEIDDAHVTIVRYPNGTLNVPLPHLPAASSSPGTPLIATLRLRNGSLDVVDESAPDRGTHLYVRGADVAATLDTAERSLYTVAFAYGERAHHLYAVRGRGDLDPSAGFALQRWNAPTLPIAGAVNVAIDSRTLHVDAGTLRNVRAMVVGFRSAGKPFASHLSATARLSGAQLALTGLSVPVRDVGGDVDVFDGGLLARSLAASVAGIPVTIGGGILGLTQPQLRMTVRGSGDLARLRSAFPQAAHLPVSGPLAFRLLAEGPVKRPTLWIALRAPSTRYGALHFTATRATIAFDGTTADLVAMRTQAEGADASARGFVGPHAVDVLLAADAPANALPGEADVLPGMPLRGIVLATAPNLRDVRTRGILESRGGAGTLAATFDVNQRGVGTVGPLLLREPGGGSIYARLALDRPRNDVFGILAARGVTVPHAGGTMNATLFAGESHGRSVALVGGRFLGSLDARAVASLSGSLSNPHARAAFVADGADDAQTVRANGTVAFARDRLALGQTVAQLGPAFGALAGTIAGVAPGAFAPRYDLDARVETSNVRRVVALVAPKRAPFVQGSLAAAMHVSGNGSTATVAGHLWAPEGSVDGLAFRGLNAAFSGTRGSMSVDGGRVTVGTSALAFHAAATKAAARVALDAPHVDLADFDDLFASGDALDGSGSVRLRAATAGQRVVASSGSVRLQDARLRRIEVGTVRATWTTIGDAIAASGAFGGPSGDVTVRARAAALDPHALLATRVDVVASARNLDLGTYLPMLGIAAPIEGKLDADLAASGTNPNLSLRLAGHVTGATYGRVAIERLALNLTATNGRGRIAQAVLRTAHLSASASGTFGLRANDPLDLTARATSDDVGKLMEDATGRNAAVTGTLASTLHISGTRAHLTAIADATLATLRYRSLLVPNASAQVAIARNEIALQRSSATVASGQLSAAGKLLLPQRTIAATATARNLQLAGFASLLPRGTKLAGTVNASIAASGPLAAPKLAGSATLAGASFSGPMERAPLTGGSGTLRLRGRDVTLASQAKLGGGTVALTGHATIPDLRNLTATTFALQARAQNARLEMPAYFTGNLDAAIALARSNASGPIALSGSAAVSHARLPLSAFLGMSHGKAPARKLPPVAFDGLRIAAGTDVRVQSGEVDIGARGSATLGGTLASPWLTGTIDTTGGTVDFYRDFDVERGSLAFAQSTGVIPYVDAVATTYVGNPQTEVRLHATGPATDMYLALSSDPAYDRTQILGILVGAAQFGAVQGVATNGSSERITAGGEAETLALGQANTVFVQHLLEPLSSSLGGALGFTNLQITSDLQTGVGVSGVKELGKDLNAVVTQNFGYPRVSSIALVDDPSVATAFRLRAYTSVGPTLFSVEQPQLVGMDALNLNPMTALAAANGTNGVEFSYVHRFP